MKVISIKQPWAHLICAGIKDVENRSWKFPKQYLGQRILVHASGSNGKKFNIQLTNEQMIAAFGSISEKAIKGEFNFGAIIGSVVVVDCVQNYDSIWAEKDSSHWIIEKPILWDRPIINVKGKLGFWDYEI